MESNLKELKEQYEKKKNNANSEAELVKIENDYKQMKAMLKLSNKIEKEFEKDMKNFDKTLANLNKEYKKLEKEMKKTDKKLSKLKSIEEIEKEYADSTKEYEKSINKIDEQLEDIDKKLAKQYDKNIIETINDMYTTREKFDELFKTDEEDRFVNLIIPSMWGFPQMDLRGKKRLELNVDEVVFLKKYVYWYTEEIIENENKQLEQLKNKQDYEFEIKGIFSDSVEGYFHYIKKDGKAEYSCSAGVDFLFNYALEKKETIGPAGQYMERDINNPLAVLFILKTEVFDKIIEVKGQLPEADEVPPEAIC